LSAVGGAAVVAETLMQRHNLECRDVRNLCLSPKSVASVIRTTKLFLDNDDWGLVRHFGTRDVRELTTRDWQLFIEKISRKRSDLSTSTRNMLMATFRNVLKIARDDGLIDVVPATPRVRQKDNPRAFFRFKPLVPEDRDEYQKLLQGAKQLATEAKVVRGVEITTELYDLILFCVHSFVRPTTTELYALRHNDIALQADPKRLLVTVRNGKTGFRVANSMAGAVAAYERLRKRYPEAGGEDYIFLPHYKNRETAARVFARHFNVLLDETRLKHDPVTETERSVYCLRHTAICMRIILSHGKVNIFNLAKNAGTSVEQIERFYAKHLPLSREMAMNLQSFGE
jgi:integrase